jgi:LacI family repressor for deo operon, udp, cdd, tsx, nupC, and nupG
MATLAEIAEQAGVSQATASRVLNDKPGVSDAARQAVLVALDVLGYERPAKLKRRSAGMAGVVVPELSNPVFPLFAQVLEQLLAQRGYTPVLCTQWAGGVSEEEYLESLLDHGVAGIIFVSGLHADTRADRRIYHRLLASGLPMVFVNGYVAELEVPCVSDDDELAMELAVAHLVGLGHRRIGLAVGPERLVPAKRKVEGFVAALRRHLDLTPAAAQAWVERTLFTREGGQAAALKLLERNATAVVCGSDLMALGAVRAARQAGLTVPGDVSVVGYDDSPLMAFVDPPMTTVRQSVPEMGAAAVSALIDAIQGEPIPANEYFFQPELVVRGTTAPPPPGDR